MSKWKCEICNKEFDNFHAQGFDNKIHCPLCYFKRENKDLKEKIKELEKMIQEYSDAEMQREEDEWMDYLIKEEEKFNDYSFMEE